MEKRKVLAVDNWVLRALIREVMHTLIVYQEDLSYFEDGDEDGDENHNNNNDDDKVNVNQAYSHCLHR